MSRIKICGLRRPEDIAAVNEARPDYCGFIVEYPKSRRSIDRATLRELVRGLREKIVPVGVFVNAPKELVAELLEEGTIQIAQLHGQESQEYIQELKVHIPAIPVREAVLSVSFPPREALPPALSVH